MTEPGSSRERLLIEAFVGLADTLVDDYDIIDLLDRLVSYCVELLAVEAAGILLVDQQGSLRVLASSNEESEMVELLQLQAEQGPCVDCVRDVAPVRVPDLAEAGQRWPQFVTALHGGAYRSVHALPLRLRGEAVGGLNLFGQAPGALPDADLKLGQGLADVATIGILQERAIRRGETINEQLQTALNSRVIIEQAKGILAERGDLSMDAAFDRLRHHARSRNLRLSELARQIVEGDPGADEVLASTAAQRSPADGH